MKGNREVACLEKELEIRVSANEFGSGDTNLQSVLDKENVESVGRPVMSDSWRPYDCSLPGSSVHGILQVRTLEWAAVSFSRD